MNNHAYISVVSPVYGCEEALPELCERLHATLSKITDDYEIVLVNDASPDNSWEVICRYAELNSRIKGVDLSRNFGQHHAITAGLDFSTGDWVVVMDCDLQDVPEEILKLHNVAKSGYDVVVGLRSERKDTLVKKYLSKAFYYVFNRLSGAAVNNRIGNFGIYSRKAIKSIQRLREQNRSFGLFVCWVGFRRAEIDIAHAARPYGTTSYTFNRMIMLALDSIVAHSDRLLRLTVQLGIVLALLSFSIVVWIIFRFLYWGVPVIGWTSLIASIYLTAGLIIGAVGIVGLYVGKIFNEVKERPLYIVNATTFSVDGFSD